MNPVHARRLIFAVFVTMLIAVSASAEMVADVPRGAGGFRHRLVSNTPGQVSSFSDLASADGRVYLVWREELTDRSQELRLRVANEGENAFGPVSASDVVARIPAEQRMTSLRVAAFGSDVYVMYAAGLTEELAEVMFLRSADRGMTFSAPRTLRAGEGNSPYADLVTDFEGVLHLVFEDRARTGDILYMTSRDAGVTFSDPANISSSETDSTRPRVAVSESNVAIVWEEASPAIRAEERRSQVMIAHSADRGVTFAAPLSLSEPSENSGTPSVAYAKSIHVVWAEKGTVAYRRSDDGAASFGRTLSLTSSSARIISPRVAAAENLIRVAWVVEDETGTHRGPIVRQSRYGGDFMSEQDLSRELGGGAFGAAALSATSRGLTAWSHTSSGLASDAEVVVSDALGACTISWVNPAGGNWVTAANWVKSDGTAGVPGATDDVCITLDGTYTVTAPTVVSIGSLALGAVTGTPTLLIRSVSGSNASFTVGAGVNNSGRIVLDSLSTTSPTLSVTTGVLANSGTIVAQAGSGGTRFITADVINDGVVSVDSPTVLTKHFTNRGSFSIAANRPVTFGVASTFTQEAGALNIAGSFEMNDDTFNHTGGAITGTVVLTNSTHLSSGGSPARSGNFLFRLGANTMSGDIAAGQTVTVQGVSGSNSELTASGPVVNDGTIRLDSASTTWAKLIVADLLNNGSIVTILGAGGQRYLTGPVRSPGTTTVDAPTEFSNFTNSGQFTINASRNVTFATPAVFTQDAGRLVINGSFVMNDDIFNFNGGDIQNGSAVLTNSTRLNIGPGASGEGHFIVQLGLNEISGNIGANTTLMIRGVSGSNSELTAVGSFSNAGEIIFDSLSTTWAELKIPTGTLTNTGTIRTVKGSGGTRYITGTVVSTATGVTTIQAATVLKDFTNAGSFTIDANQPLSFVAPARFTQEAGTLTINGTFLMNDGRFHFINGTMPAGTAVLENSTELALEDSATGAARFVFRRGLNAISGNIGAGTTVTIQGTSGSNADVTAAASFSSAGKIVLDSLSTTWAQLTITSGTLTSTGAIETWTGSGGHRYLTGAVRNEGTVSIQAATTFTNFINAADFTIATSHELTFGTPAEFTQEAGTLVISGAFLMNDDRFNFNGGNITGGDVILANSSELHLGPNADGTAAFIFHQGLNTMTGNVGPGTSINIRGISGSNTSVTATEAFTNEGTIWLDSLSTTWAELKVPAGTLTNAAGATIRTITGSGGDRFLEADVINLGTVLIEASTILSKHFINRGAFSTAASKPLTFGVGATFSQESGTLSNLGSFTMNDDVFNHTGGAISGNSVVLTNSTSFHSGGDPARSGAFVFRLGGNTITGSIAAAQTVVVQGVSGSNSKLTVPSGLPSAGEIVLDSASTTWAELEITGGAVVSTGRIRTVTGNGGLRYLSGPVVSSGVTSIEGPTEIKNFTNSGQFTVSVSKPVTFGAGATFTQDAGQLAINGSFVMNDDTFNFNGGEMAGNPAVLQNSTILNIGPAATGAANFVVQQGGNILNGNIGPGTTIRVQGVSGANALLTSPVGFANAGRIILDSVSTTYAWLVVTNGALTNALTGVIQTIPGNGGGRFLTASVVNLGLVDLDANLTYDKVGGIFTNHGVVDLSGRTLDVTGGGTSFLQPAPGSVIGGGTLSMGAGTILKGVGTITANVLNSGAFHPGGSPGVLNIVGNWIQRSGSSLNIELGGPTPGEYDQLNVSGAVTLTGALNVSLFGGYCPAGSFDFLTYGSRNGTTDFSPKNGLIVGGGRVLQEAIIPGSPNIYRLTTVGPVCNTAPSAADDSYQANQGSTLSVPAPGVLSNDSDNNPASMTAVLVSGPTNGTLTLQTNGSFVYTPNPNFVGFDSFRYSARDEQFTSDPATVSIEVADTIAPVTTATVSPAPNVNGWHKADFTITLSANDGFGSGVREIRYSIDDGPFTVQQGGVVNIPWSTEGVFTLNYLAVDNSDNEESPKTLTLKLDKTAPSLEAPAAIAAFTGASATSCQALVSDLGSPTATDALSTPFVTVTGVPANNVFPLGTTLITYRATDAAGNETVATQNVVVGDDTAPVISAPAGITVTTSDTGTSCGVEISQLGMTTASDNCGTPGVTITGVPAGNLFPVGTTVVTYTATDASGNTAVATQEVTVTDNTAPSITAPAPINVATGAGATSCSVTIEDLGAATVTDNCGTPNVVVTGVPENNLFPVGTTRITYTATDAAGNISSATQDVTVSDGTNPSLSVPPAINITTAPGAASCAIAINDFGISTAEDNCGAAEITITGIPANNLFPVGTTVLTYVATDASGNTTTKTQDVVVTDGTAPQVVAPADISAQTAEGSASCGVVISDLGAPSATDNCGSAAITVSGVPAGNVFPVGITVITYTATDDSGNTAVATQSVIVTDNTAPVIAAPASITLQTGPEATSCGIVITNLGLASASDNCGTATVTVSGVPAANLFPVGTTVITYTATDAAGNTSTATQNVTVVDDTPPVIATLADITVSAGASCTAVVDGLRDATATDNCGTATVTVILPVESRFGLGTTELTYVARDANGNTSSVTRRVTVIDDTPPFVRPPDDVVEQAEPGATGAFVGNILVGSAFTSDNCPGVTLVVTGIPPNSFFPIGTTVVMYKATDAAGNTTVATQNVTIEAADGDTTPPTITIITPASGGQYGLDRVIQSSFSCADDTGIAECSGPELVDTSSLGLKTFTVTARDNAGNAATKEVAYEVVNDGVMLVLDRDAVDRLEFGLSKGDIGLREQLSYFAQHIGDVVTLPGGLVKNEGWFALQAPPASWITAGPTTNGNLNYVLAGPGLGTGPAKSREDLLKSVPGVLPLQFAGLQALVGQRVYAVVMDGKVQMRAGVADLRGKNLGVVAFEVIALQPGSDTSLLPAVQVKILDSTRYLQGLKQILTFVP